MKLKTLKDLCIHELKDLYSAEKQWVKALPRMAQAATNPELRAGFETNLEETNVHVQRLASVLARVGAATRGPECKGMEGLLEEGSFLIEEEPDPGVLDTGLICAAQKVEHYEIAGYGCVRTNAKLPGDEVAIRLLQTTWGEEGATDQMLTQLAETSINLAEMGGE